MNSWECPFCQRIDRGEYESGPTGESVVWFEPLNPVTPGHTLFVPTRHVEHNHPGSPRAVAAAMKRAAQYARERGEAFNLITSSGPAATQTVPHIHIHYVPRRTGDGLPLPWIGQAEREAARAEVHRWFGPVLDLIRQKADQRVAEEGARQARERLTRAGFPGGVTYAADRNHGWCSCPPNCPICAMSQNIQSEGNPT